MSELLGRWGTPASAITLAEETTRPESNRSEGAEGVMLRSDTLPDDVRRELFDRMLVLAQTDIPPTAVDIQFSGGRHPLSAFRADLQHGDLHREALQAAAALAQDEEQAVLVVTRALSWLGREDKDIYAAVRALSILNSDLFAVDLGLFTAHPSRVARQLAVSFAIKDHLAGAETLRALSADPDRTVRVSVGYACRQLADRAPDLARELAERLWDDPNWSVRQLARDSFPAHLDDPDPMISSPTRGSCAVALNATVESDASATDVISGRTVSVVGSPRLQGATIRNRAAPTTNLIGVLMSPCAGRRTCTEVHLTSPIEV